MNACQTIANHSPRSSLNVVVAQITLHPLVKSPLQVFPVNTHYFMKSSYSGTPEFETADLSQSHARLNFGLVVYFIETQVQQPKIIETRI